MKMVKNVCDRCGREFEGGAYYTIDIYGHDVNPTNDGRMSLDAASQNIATNLYKSLNLEKHFCKHCVQEIANFIGQPRTAIDASSSAFEEYVRRRRKEF